jgi:two-component system chemotaxis sensor kinase CheA
MDDFSKDELEQLMAVFREQAESTLDEMAQDLLLLEAEESEPEVMSRLRRAAHTIKGDSACIGLEGIGELAHSLEDVLAASADGELKLGPAVVDVMLESLDQMRNAINGDEVGDISDRVLSVLLARLSELRSSKSDGPAIVEEKSTSVLIGEPSAESQVLAPPLSIPTLVPAAAPDDHEALPSGAKAGAKRKRRGPEYVRVEAARIDALMNLAGEMVIARSIMNQVIPELETTLGAGEFVGRFGAASLQMGKLIAELQKSVLKMRMVTIDQVFRRFGPHMRELASEHGKVVELEVSGGETELDRTLVDLIYEPLLHLLRNAVDHGIEPADERETRGKPRAGKITLRAFHEGNQVVIEVADDGRGVDVAALKARAIESGKLSGAEVDEMTDEEALNLIFYAGLSTAREITRISGRGIGGAAVKSVVEELRGSISVRTEPGIGTTFVLRMPLTLAIIKALLFTVSGWTFALPLLAVNEVARTTESDVVLLDDFENFRLRNRFISLVRPARIFGLERRRGGRGRALRGSSPEMFIIVVSVGGKRVGIAADTLIGEQEIVIKPLESQWLYNDALAGASVLGDGRVALIMDAGAIFRKALKFENAVGIGGDRLRI